MITIYEGPSGCGKTSHLDKLRRDRKITYLKPFDRGYARRVFHSLSKLSKTSKRAALLSVTLSDFQVSLEYIRCYSGGLYKNKLVAFDRLLVAPTCLYVAYSKHWKLDFEDVIWELAEKNIDILKLYDVRFRFFDKIHKSRKFDYDPTGRISKMFDNLYKTVQIRLGL